MKYFTVCMLILSGALPFFLIDGGTPIFSENYLIAKEQAKNSEKSLLLLFVTDECRICEDQKDMMENDSEISKFIYNSYESAIININDFDGKAIRDYYKINYVPSMLVVNQKGEVMWKHDGNISKSNFIQSLSGEKMNIVQSKSDLDNSSVNSESFTNQSSSEVIALDRKSSQVVSQVSENEGVKRNVSNLISYQIQYGFFGSYENATSMLTKLSKTGQSECYIKDEDRNGKTYYRVLSPFYAQIDVATDMLNKMKSKGIDGQMKTIN